MAANSSESGVPMKLLKILMMAGVGPRRQCRAAILDGAVAVNGTVITDPWAEFEIEKDHIKVDGKKLKTLEPKTYILLYKPRGYVSTISDPQGRPSVAQLISKLNLRLYPVGRLDFNSEGIILMTNDGDLAHGLLHPSRGVTKTYCVKVRGEPSPKAVEKLRRGVKLSDGRTAPAKVSILRRTGSNCWLSIAICEGRNREVRRMCMAVGHPVSKLKRVKIAFLALEGLEPGQFRVLSQEEVKRLKIIAGVTS